jgi:hypothetical protein
MGPVVESRIMLRRGYPVVVSGVVTETYADGRVTHEDPLYCFSDTIGGAQVADSNCRPESPLPEGQLRLRPPGGR